jgi:hypothetical protein
MNRPTIKRVSSILVFLFLFAPETVSAQVKSGAKQDPDPREVFAELVRPYRDMNDYTVKIHAKIQMPAIRVPDFSAILFFKKPEKFHIETKSFAPIPRDSGVFNPFRFDPEKNLITYLRTESLDGAPLTVFRMEPLETKATIRNYHVWIGQSPVRVVQVESLSIKGVKGLVKLSYGIVERGAEKWLLPNNVHVHLTFPEGSRSNDPFSSTARENPVSSGMRGLDEMSGEGDIFLSYSEWQVNTGLDDRLFQKNAR